MKNQKERVRLRAKVKTDKKHKRGEEKSELNKNQ
jgi:hypothetical protein